MPTRASDMAASRQCSPAKQSGEGHYDTSLPKLVADVQDQVAPIFEAGVVTRDRTTCAAWSRASIRSSKSVSALIDMHNSGAGAVEMGA